MANPHQREPQENTCAPLAQQWPSLNQWDPTVLSPNLSLKKKASLEHFVARTFGHDSMKNVTQALNRWTTQAQACQQQTTSTDYFMTQTSAHAPLLTTYREVSQGVFQRPLEESQGNVETSAPHPIPAPQRLAFCHDVQAIETPLRTVPTATLWEQVTTTLPALKTQLTALTQQTQQRWAFRSHKRRFLKDFNAELITKQAQVDHWHAAIAQSLMTRLVGAVAAGDTSTHQLIAHWHAHTVDAQAHRSPPHDTWAAPVKATDPQVLTAVFHWALHEAPPALRAPLWQRLQHVMAVQGTPTAFADALAASKKALNGFSRFTRWLIHTHWGRRCFPGRAFRYHWHQQQLTQLAVMQLHHAQAAAFLVPETEDSPNPYQTAANHAAPFGTAPVLDDTLHQSPAATLNRWETVLRANIQEYYAAQHAFNRRRFHRFSGKTQTTLTHWKNRLRAQYSQLIQLRLDYYKQHTSLIRTLCMHHCLLHFIDKTVTYDAVPALKFADTLLEKTPLLITQGYVKKATATQFNTLQQSYQALNHSLNTLQEERSQPATFIQNYLEKLLTLISDEKNRQDFLLQWWHLSKNHGNNENAKALHAAIETVLFDKETRDTIQQGIAEVKKKIERCEQQHAEHKKLLAQYQSDGDNYREKAIHHQKETDTAIDNHRTLLKRYETQLSNVVISVEKPGGKPSYKQPTLSTHQNPFAFLSKRSQNPCAKATLLPSKSFTA